MISWWPGRRAGRGEVGGPGPEAGAQQGQLQHLGGGGARPRGPGGAWTLHYQVVTIALQLLTTRVTTGLAQGQEDLLKPLLIISPTLGLEDECPRGGWHGQGTVI